MKVFLRKIWMEKLIEINFIKTKTDIINFIGLLFFFLIIIIPR